MAETNEGRNRDSFAVHQKESRVKQMNGYSIIEPDQKKHEKIKMAQQKANDRAKTKVMDAEGRVQRPVPKYLVPSHGVQLGRKNEQGKDQYHYDDPGRARRKYFREKKIERERHREAVIQSEKIRKEKPFLERKAKARAKSEKLEKKVRNEQRQRQQEVRQHWQETIDEWEYFTITEQLKAPVKPKPKYCSFVNSHTSFDELKQLCREAKEQMDCDSYCVMMKTIQKIVINARDDPGKRIIKLSNPTFFSKVGQWDYGQMILSSLGFNLVNSEFTFQENSWESLLYVSPVLDDIVELAKANKYTGENGEKNRNQNCSPPDNDPGSSSSSTGFAQAQQRQQLIQQQNLEYLESLVRDREKEKERKAKESSLKNSINTKERDANSKGVNTECDSETKEQRRAKFAAKLEKKFLNVDEKR
mmetsp:Transcript_17518/g.22484  ORF Transcript_17518/g.22484 Transcript_17518/m.22484 type:complete len:417 (-) Transcript_17518:213-1463(-)